MTTPSDDYTLWVQSIGYNGESVTLNTSDNNPMNKSIGRIATVEIFPGLEVL